MRMAGTLARLAGAVAFGTVASAALAQAAPPALPAQAAPAAPPILEAESSGTLTLPPATPYRLFLSAGDGFHIINAQTAKVEGMINGGGAPVLDIATAAPGTGRFYVAESHWSRGNRGTRVDLVAVYDSTTLNLVSEIEVPGRLIAGGRSNYFAVSPDGRRGYVFNLEPATAVHVVDLEKRRFLRTIETPGCSLVYPLGDAGFASMCADGSVATVAVDAAGRGRLTQSPPFFDSEQDPLFEESLIDRETGVALLVALTGKVWPAKLSVGKAEIGEPWFLQSAAGLAPATTGVQHETWRPGGRRPFALHRETNTLFVLMHLGKHWSHYDPGTEVWAIDATTRQLKGRFTLPTAGSVIGVSQGKEPLLYVAGTGDWLWIMDPASGKVLRTMKEVRRPGLIRTTGF